MATSEQEVTIDVKLFCRQGEEEGAVCRVRQGIRRRPVQLPHHSSGHHRSPSGQAVSDGMPLTSSVPDTVCKCGKVMQLFGQSPQNDGSTAAGDSEDGVFVKGCLKFIITDDLQVAPASTSLMLSLFEKFGVGDPADLEKAVVNLSSDKIKSLLKRSLTSKQPFTGYYFAVPNPPEDASLETLHRDLYEQANNDEQKVNDVKIRVLQAKNSSSLLYAEVGDDFVDLLFGLLSVPLGSMIKTFGQGTSKGCLDNLYSSINGSAKECMKPECRSLLLAPSSWPFFGSGATKILQVEESAPNKLQLAVSHPSLCMPVQIPWPFRFSVGLHRVFKDHCTPARSHTNSSNQNTHLPSPMAKTVDVKLFIDKEKKKVLFAESDKEFVDVLFGFLTMPLGSRHHRSPSGQAVSDGVP
ncbi:hypothetical protein HU200_010796 [Digitaria exilis]|uniref:DUF674 family protein n=1 Tax=Digitaria exilis TaxID=1010633 RepID=A0A835FJ22_9POAL|nr:hypothetical protein HU200_010796 [Digitaria exilis]